MIGAARSELDAHGYRALVAEAVREEHGAGAQDAPLDAFLAQVGYVAIDARGNDGWAELKAEMGQDRTKAFYFSVGPGLFGDLAERLKAHGIADSQSRIVVEKPSAAIWRRPGRSTPRSRAISKRRRSTGSITTSARKRSRT